MNMSLSPVISRTLAVAILIALAGAVYAFAVEPVLDAHRGYAESIEQSRRLIAQFGIRAAARPELERQVAQLEKKSKSTSGYLEDESAALAAARLQNQVKRIVARNGGSIRSLQPLQPERERNLERVAIRVDLTARIEQLQKIFYAFETGQTQLFLDDVNIRVQRARRARRGRSRGRAPEVDEHLLTVRLNLYGFARREGT